MKKLGRVLVLGLLTGVIMGGASAALPDTGVGLSTDFQGDLDVLFRDTNNNLDYVDDSGNVVDTGVDPSDVGGVADFDGDGDLDVLFRDTSSNLKYVDDSGNVVDTGQDTFSVGGVADFDGDGDLDVLFRDTNDNLKYVDDSGNVVDTGQDAFDVGGVADFDGDGDLDVLFRDTSSNLKYVDDSGNVVDTGQDAGGVGGVADFDGDGDLDVLFLDLNDNVKYVDDSGNVVDTGVDAEGVGGVADFDGDGDLDVLFQDTNSNFRNRGLKYVDDSGNVVDTGVDTFRVGGVADFDGDTNAAPQFSSTSISPDPPLIGETADFSYSASDPDGSISSVDLVLKDDGTQIFSGSKSTASGTFSPPDTLTKGDITATFTATDNKGATTTETLTRTLQDTKPVVNITQPSGTFFDYDQSIRVETQVDDSNPDEQLSCVLDLDSNKIDQRTVKEGQSYTVNTRADLGSHNLNVTCTEQDDGKQDTGSTSFTVENFEFQTLTGVSTAEETTEQSFTAGFKAGEMVNNISFDLVYDGEVRDQATVNVSGVTDSSQGFSHVLNLAQTDGETRNYNVSAEVDYDNLNTGTSTDNVDSSSKSQTVNQAFSYNDSVFEDGLTQLEASTLDFEAQINKQVTNNRASLSASSTLQQTGETRTLEKDGLNFTGVFNTDLINSTSTTTNLDTTVTVSFNGESRTFSNTDTLSLEKIQLAKSSSTGPKTLQFETRDEINNSLIDANVEAGITVNNPDQPEKTRFFGFDFNKDKTHELFLSPADATITANVFEERSIAYENLDAGFPGRRHYLTDTTLDNETTNINLYLLEQTKGQTVRLELTNSDLQGLSNHLIRVERAFPDQNETRTVQLAKTGTEGFASTFLQLQERYIFTVFDENGDLVDQVGPETVTTSDKRIQVNDNIDPSLANVLNEVQFTDIQRGNQSLSVSYVSETQRLNNLFLKISSDGLFETQTLDVDSSEQPQGQLEVTDFNASDQRVFFELIGTFGETNLTLESGTFGQESNDFGNAGIFVSFLMFTALTLSGLFRPSAAIGLGVVSIFVMSFTGFLAVGQQALISIAALAAVLIWRMSSQ